MSSEKPSPSPGPWRAGVDDPHVKVNAVVDADGALVCELPIMPAGTKMANARLIAAAPEMAELLRGAADFYCGEMPGGSDRREAIRALLARIDGRG